MSHVPVPIVRILRRILCDVEGSLTHPLSDRSRQEQVGGGEGAIERRGPARVALHSQHQVDQRGRRQVVLGRDLHGQLVGLGARGKAGQGLQLLDTINGRHGVMVVDIHVYNHRELALFPRRVIVSRWPPCCAAGWRGEVICRTRRNF